MGLFGKKGPPNIDELKATKNIKGLIKALKWQQHHISGSEERGLDELDRKKAALAIAEISGIKAIDSLIEVIREAEHKKFLLGQFDRTVQQSRAFTELTCICQATKEAFPIVGQSAVDHILKFLRKWKLDFVDINRYRYWDEIKKSLLEVLTNIGDEKTVLKNLFKAKDSVRSETFFDVFQKWFSEISASDEILVKLARMAAQAVNANDFDTFSAIRSALRTRVDVDRFTHVLRTHLSMSEQVATLNALVEKDTTPDIEGVQDMTKRCVHCGSAFYEPKTMMDKTDFNAMQKVQVGCSKCGMAVCFSCASTAADQRGKEGNCFCPRCYAELGGGGEAGELGGHFSGWN
jgi:hypothetical protein